MVHFLEGKDDNAAMTVFFHIHEQFLQHSINNNFFIVFQNGKRDGIYPVN